MAPRSLHKLSARRVETLHAPGRYGDGGGLILAIGANGKGAWVFRYQSRLTGKPVEMGLGPRADLSLADAREKAAQYRNMIVRGHDPRTETRARRARKVSPTILETLDMFLVVKTPGWRSVRQKNAWRNSLTIHAPKLMKLPIDQVVIDDVVEPLQAIWDVVPETAGRVRARIEAVIDFATAKKLREGSNPARWARLKHVLPKRKMLVRGHHPALPYAQLPQLIIRLRASSSVSAMALEFTILTCARSGETLGMRWGEVDIGKRLWIVPAHRMKGGREHVVPLSDRAVAILREAWKLRREADDYCFPGHKPRRPMCGVAMERVLRRFGYPRAAASVHGMRSSFRDWAAETGAQRETAESCIAHSIAMNKTERAYLRTRMLANSRTLLAAWERFLMHHGARKMQHASDRAHQARRSRQADRVLG